MHIEQASTDMLQQELQALESQYQGFKAANLNLDLTRGKPGSGQLDLSSALDGILAGDYKTAAGVDTRNYGGLDGIPEAKQLFCQQLGVDASEILIGGNASLTLMFQVMNYACHFGLQGPESAWNATGAVKFLCPVPGYDRHFSVCEELNIEMIPVPMLDTGPDMDQVEALVKADPAIKGIWCVPRFSNPTGIVYSDEVVARLAKLPAMAGPQFLIMWDNAYAVHELVPDAQPLANIMDLARSQGTADGIAIFGSTSKITFAGSGLAFVGLSPANLKGFSLHLSKVTIGPDKVNQLRHVRFFKDFAGLQDHMKKHADQLKPRFDAVLSALDEGLAGTGMGHWNQPQGGYFISFDALPGLAQEIVDMAGAVGVKLTPAGATFPYGKDPEDKNIRLAPSFPSLADIGKIMDVFVVCVKIASIRQALQ